MTVDSYHCYHPYNLQTRVMSNNCIFSHYLFNNSDPEDELTDSMENMLALSHVGIQELYDASMCLFWLRTGQKVNIMEFCFNPFHVDIGGETHHVPPHSVDDIEDSVW